MILYAATRAESLIRGPRLVDLLPEDGYSTDKPYVLVSGKAINVTNIKLSGRTVFTDEFGNFQEQLLLPIGYSIITLEARDRFGRSHYYPIELTRTNNGKEKGNI